MSCARTVLDKQSKAIAATNIFIGDTPSAIRPIFPPISSAHKLLRQCELIHTRRYKGARSSLPSWSAASPPKAL
jgi:hypothetical protein